MRANGLIDHSTPAIVAENVSVELGGARVLEGVSFSAGPGSLMGVVGPNGGGKSTLFNSIVGLLPLQEGRVLIHGRSPKEVRGAIAYVPQREMVNWRFPLTAWDVVMLGRARKIGWLRRHGRRDREIVRESLERVDMWDRRSSLITELSGGQRQRVFVARALAQEAEILLLDEAFSGVDVASQEGLVTVLRGLRNEGKTILMATHDLTNLARRFDEVLCLNHHVCAHGHPQVAFTPAVLEELYGAHGVFFANNGDQFDKLTMQRQADGEHSRLSD
ncbi:MAG: metal ABC transporter ATP-binding protein [Chloroflexi bacterium]|nr:metal ABC transporter ATP-binding protein [Chloroflexota bacterium]